MKKWITLLVFVFAFAVGSPRVHAQAFDIEQLLLDVQKLTELKQILQDLKDGYRSLEARYTAIRDLAKGSFTLHKLYLDGLLAVSLAVRQDPRVAGIIDMQVRILQRYQSVWPALQQDKNLQPAELAALDALYTGILAASGNDLDDLNTSLTDGRLRSSDADRLDLMDAISHRMRAKLALIDQVSNQAALLAAQRAAEARDVTVLRQWFGLTP